MLRKTIVLPLFMLMSFFSRAENIDGVNFDVNQVSENVYVLAQPYGETLINFGVVKTEKGTVLISSMMFNHAPKIEKLVKKVVGTGIDYVINIDPDNYHHHANKYFASKGATIIGQNHIKQVNKHIDIGFDSEMNLDLGNEVISVTHTAARNLGDSAVYLQKHNIIFMGDSFSNAWFAPSNTSGYKKHIEALREVLASTNDSTIFVPGNRKSVAYNTQKDFENIIKRRQQFATTVKSLLLQGLSTEEICNHKDILAIATKLERYNEFKKYLPEKVQDVIQNI